MNSKYEHALINNLMIAEDGEYVSILEWVHRNIDKSPNKEVVVNMTYMKKILGPKFANNSQSTIYGPLHRAFIKYGINMKIRKCDDGLKITLRKI